MGSRPGSSEAALRSWEGPANTNRPVVSPSCSSPAPTQVPGLGEGHPLLTARRTQAGLSPRPTPTPQPRGRGDTRPKGGVPWKEPPRAFILLGPPRPAQAQRPPHSPRPAPLLRSGIFLLGALGVSFFWGPWEVGVEGAQLGPWGEGHLPTYQGPGSTLTRMPRVCPPHLRERPCATWAPRERDPQGAHRQLGWAGGQ